MNSVEPVETAEEIQAKINELEARLVAVRLSEYQSAKESAQALITKHGIKASDLKFDGVAAKPAKAPRKPAKVISIKYRDDAGHTWTGRGLKPRWLATAIEGGKALESFAV